MAAAAHILELKNASSTETRPENAYRVGPLLILFSLLLGAIHAWIGRSSMNPDGISYLDVGDAFVQHDWTVAINGWWSPLYAWISGVVINAVRPAPQWEFPLVHAVNFLIFTFALFAFRFFLSSLLTLTRTKYTRPFPASGEVEFLPEWCVELMGYAIFLWISLEVITVYA